MTLLTFEVKMSFEDGEEWVVRVDAPSRQTAALGVLRRSSWIEALLDHASRGQSVKLDVQRVA